MNTKGSFFHRFPKILNINLAILKTKFLILKRNFDEFISMW